MAFAVVIDIFESTGKRRSTNDGDGDGHANDDSKNEFIKDIEKRE